MPPWKLLLWRLRTLRKDKLAKDGENCALKLQIWKSQGHDPLPFWTASDTKPSAKRGPIIGQKMSGSCNKIMEKQ